MRFPSAFNKSLVVLGLALASPVRCQERMPPEVSALPLWPGSDVAQRRFPDNWAFRDGTGEIVLIYPDPEDPSHRLTSRFRLQNRVIPRVAVGLSHPDGEMYIYRYALANDVSAKSPVGGWRIVSPPSADNRVSHPVWQGDNAFQFTGAPQMLFPSAGPGSYLGWSDTRARLPIKPGGELNGFEIRSRYRPGLTTAYVSGAEDYPKVPDAIPEALQRQIEVLERPGVLNRAVATIGPRFPPNMRRSDIAHAFRNDLDDLAKEGLIGAGSSLFRSLVRELERTERSEHYVIVVPADQASSPLEEQIVQALPYALPNPE